MNISRKIKLFIALFSLLLSLSLIQDTYAKYVSSADANANMNVARWNVIVNNQDVKTNSNFTDTIIPVFEGTSNINANIIAPTSTGYFDVILDMRNTDVSFSYSILIKVAEESAVKDLIITGYKVNEGDLNHFNDLNYLINNDVLLNDSKYITYRFYVKWDDSESATMDNVSDTLVANTGVASFDISIDVIQKADHVDDTASLEDSVSDSGSDDSSSLD